MTVQVDFWHLISLLIGFITTLGTFGLLLFSQIDKRIDAQNKRITDVERSLNQTLMMLPLEYQRREDAIRFETTLNAKLDAIGTRLEKLSEKQ
jgi:hypothetical protein